MSRTRLISVVGLVVLLTVILSGQAMAGGLTPIAGSPFGLGAGATAPKKVVVFDMDGDGNKDLIVLESGKLSILINNGAGGFTPTTQSPYTVDANASDVFVATGLSAAFSVDIVVANGTTHTVDVFQRTAFNHATSSVTLGAAYQALTGIVGDDYQGVWVADVDGDGANDVLVANKGANQLIVTFGNQDTTFSNTKTQAVGTSPVAVLTGAFTGGALPDIAVLNQASNNVSVFQNTTAAGSVKGSKFAIAATTNSPFTVGTGPVAFVSGTSATFGGTGDGIAVADGDAHATVMKNSGTGDFSSGIVTVAVSAAPTGIALGDFNGDAVNDIVVSNANGAELLINSGPGTFASPTVSTFKAGTTNASVTATTALGNPANAVIVPDSASTNVVILSYSPLAVSPLALTGTEGSSTSQPIVTFTDDSVLNTTNFTYTVDWGFAVGVVQQITTCATAPCAGISGGPSPGTPFTLTLPPLSAWPDEGTFTVTTNITDTNGKAGNTALSTATISDAQPLTKNAITHTVSAAPGAAITDLTVMNFTDPNTLSTTNADYDVTINWGDGGPVDHCTPGTCPSASGSSPRLVTSAAPTSFTVDGTHTYTNGGTFTITTTVFDKGTPAAPITDTVTATISSFSSMTANPQPATNEGSPISNKILATFVSTTNDNASTFTGTVNWGDGTTDTPCLTSGGSPNCSITTGPNCKGGGCDIKGTHTYAEAPGNPSGTYTVTISVLAADGSTDSTNYSQTVNDKTITVTGATVPALTFVEGNLSSGVTMATFSDGNGSAVASNFSATIAWGDGGTDTNCLSSGGNPNCLISGPTGGPFTVTGQHLYVEHGVPLPGPIQVTVTDLKSSQVQSGTPTLTVADAPLTVTNCAGPGQPPCVILQKSAGPPPQPLLVNTDKYNGSLGSFQDGAGAYTQATDFDNPTPSATPVNTVGSWIDWGDGGQENCSSVAANTPNCVIHVNTLTGAVTVDTGALPGGHVFTKGGSALPVVVTIIDKGGQTATINDAANVTSIINLVFDPGNKLSATAVPPVTEGNSTTMVQVVTFTSLDGAAVVTSFDNLPNNAPPVNTAKTYIDWGDTAQDQCSNDSSPAPTGTPNCVITGTPPNFIITAQHTYAEGGLDGNAGNQNLCVVNGVAPNAHGDCKIVVHIVDNVDSSSANPNGTVSIFDATLNPAVGQPTLTADEGQGKLNGGGNVIVGNFTDNNPGATVSDFTTGTGNAAVDYFNCGPNHGPLACGTVPATVVANGTVVGSQTCGAQFCVVGPQPANPFETGSYTFLISVTDKGGQSFTGQTGATATITDAPLGNPVITAPTGGLGQGGALVANQDVFSGTVATFTDGNNVAPVTDFTVTIDWGDGSVPDSGCNSSGGNPNCSVGGSGGTYTVSGSHKFIQAGSLLSGVKVTVNDVDGASSSATGPKANVTSLTGAAFTMPTPQVEGVAFSVPVGSFDSTTGHTNFNITINWGDGSPLAGPSAVVPGAPAPPLQPWTVVGDYTYGDENPLICGGATCTVTVTVTDPLDNSSMTISGTISVQDAPLSVMPAPTIVAAAGQPLSGVVVGKFQDANSVAPVTDFTSVTVYWNDIHSGCNPQPCPSSPGTLTKLATPPGAPTQFQITASYAGYNINDTYGITFDVVDKGGSKITGGAGATVTNAPGVLTGFPQNLTPASGFLTATTQFPLGVFSNTNPALPVSDYTGTINWGDGSPTENCSDSAVSTPTCYYVAKTGSPGTFLVLGSHTYTQLGQTFPITIFVQDQIGNATVTFTSTANIPNVVPTDFVGGISPPQSQIQAGQSVDILVTLSPNPNPGVAPFNSPVVFTGCTILSGPSLTGLTCSFNPTQVPDVMQVRQVHVTVQSFAAVAMDKAPPKPGSNRPVQLALLLPAFVGTFGVVLLGSKKNKRRTIAWWIASFLLLALLLVGCGGGAGLVTPTGNATSTVPGTYILQINTNIGTVAGAPCSLTATGTGPCLTAQVTITK